MHPIETLTKLWKLQKKARFHLQSLNQMNEGIADEKKEIPGFQAEVMKIRQGYAPVVRKKLQRIDDYFQDRGIRRPNGLRHFKIFSRQDYAQDVEFMEDQFKDGLIELFIVASGKFYSPNVAYGVPIILNENALAKGSNANDITDQPKPTLSSNNVLNGTAKDQIDNSKGNNDNAPESFVQSTGFILVIVLSAVVLLSVILAVAAVKRAKNIKAKSITVDSLLARRMDPMRFTSFAGSTRSIGHERDLEVPVVASPFVEPMRYWGHPSGVLDREIEPRVGSFGQSPFLSRHERGYPRTSERY